MEHTGMDHTGMEHTGMEDMMGDHSMPHTDADMDTTTTMDTTMDTTGSKVMMDMPKRPFCGGGMNHHDGMTGMNMGGGMTMYMDGFRSTLASDSDTPCLNLFFPDWTLDTRGKFVVAMFGVLALAICVEGISALRLYAHKRMTPGRKRKCLIMGMHGSQALFGYVLMMATMTFSIELLLSVCAGLGAGYGIFFDDSTDTSHHVTTNPCCGFMADEALETTQAFAKPPSTSAVGESLSASSTESSEKRRPSSCCDDDDEENYNAQTAIPTGTA